MSSFAFRPTQAVHLVDDPDFLGYVVGRIYTADNLPTSRINLSISKPGKSGLVGNVSIEDTRLTPAEDVPPMTGTGFKRDKQTVAAI